MQLTINNWATTLEAPAGSAALGLAVPAPDAARLGVIGPGDYYAATLARVTSGVESAWEVVHITSISGGVLTVERAKEGTTALDWQAGESISVRLTSGLIEDLRASIPAPSGSRFGAPRPAVGQYISAQIASGLLAGQQFFQASIRLAALEVPVAVTIDQLLCHATTSGAGRQVRLGIYASDANGWPAYLLRETAALSAATAGPISGDITPLTLEPGQLYWLALQTSAGFFVYCITVGAILCQPTNTETGAQSLSRVIAFGGALPANWVYNPAELTSLPPPHVIARRSA